MFKREAPDGRALFWRHLVLLTLTFEAITTLFSQRERESGAPKGVGGRPRSEYLPRSPTFARASLPCGPLDTGSDPACHLRNIPRCRQLS